MADQEMAAALEQGQYALHYLALGFQIEINHHIAQKIMDVTSGPISVKGQDLRVGCSIGISMFPKDGTDYDTLLKNADAAMYRAKESGRNNFQFYASAIQEAV